MPYVNARPHIGFALKLVQADVLARHYRGTGSAVRFQAGTDDNSLKNVLAAEASGVGVQEFVDRNAAAFTVLARPLSLSADDTIRTSRDPRHRIGVHHLWQACAASGERRAASGGLDAVLGDLLRACRSIGERLRPFLPDAAARITRQCEAEPDGRLPAAVPALPRIECLDPA